MSPFAGGKIRGPDDREFVPRPASEMDIMKDNLGALLGMAAAQSEEKLKCDVTIFTGISPHFESQLASSVADGGADPSDMMGQIVAMSADFLLGNAPRA